jgi:hypothetical protein
MHTLSTPNNWDINQAILPAADRKITPLLPQTSCGVVAVDLS